MHHGISEGKGSVVGFLGIENDYRPPNTTTECTRAELDKFIIE